MRSMLPRGIARRTAPPLAPPWKYAHLLYFRKEGLAEVDRAKPRNLKPSGEGGLAMLSGTLLGKPSKRKEELRGGVDTTIKRSTTPNPQRNKHQLVC